MDGQAKVRKRSTLSWIMEFAGSRRESYALSVLLAILSVGSGFAPYIFMANIVKGLLERSVNFQYCLTQCLWMALFFVLGRVFHAFSTTLSHKATFEVLANIRRRLTRKLAKMPLGNVLEESSGTYKNIIVERVDSIETTLAHMIPEVTSNLIIPFVIFGYMVRIDWRLALEKVVEAAKKASCHDFILALPDGYDTVIGEGGASLSGGEKQRISIARAIMKDAPIIILDEATANVDPENETELTEAIEELTKEKTIIMIAHRLKTVRHADQIFVVDNGRIVQRGTHEQLIAKDGIYRTFVEGQQEAASWKIA